jgi:hypothetical protein
MLSRHRIPIPHDVSPVDTPQRALTENLISSIETLTAMKNVYLSEDEVFLEELCTGASEPLSAFNRWIYRPDARRVLRNLNGETP